MKYIIAIVILLFSVTACSGLKQHEQALQNQAQQAGLIAVEKSRFDAAFILPSATFDQYKKIIVKDIDLSQAVIIEPSARGSFAQPWTLNEEDKRYYQARFAESAKASLLDSGMFTRATESAADTLVLTTKITEIAPHAAKDDAKSRPNLMNVYSEGFGRMTIVFELSDSITNRLIMVATDERDLGNLWELNNRVQNNLRIRLAFDYWLHTLEKELNAVKQRY